MVPSDSHASQNPPSTPSSSLQSLSYWNLEPSTPFISWRWSNRLHSQPALQSLSRQQQRLLPVKIETSWRRVYDRAWRTGTHRRCRVLLPNLRSPSRHLSSNVTIMKYHSSSSLRSINRSSVLGATTFDKLLVPGIGPNFGSTRFVRRLAMSASRSLSFFESRA